MNKSRQQHSIFWPIVLIAAGIIFLLSNIGVLSSGVGELLGTYWPLIFVAAGLDGIFKREGWVGSIILIGLGTVLVLGNLGYFAWDSLGLLLRLWPLFLIAWGFDLIFKNRPAWATIIGVLLAAALVGGILWLGFTQTGRAVGTTVTVEETIPTGAKEFKLEIEIPAGSLQIGTGAESNQLAAGQISLPRGLSLEPSQTLAGDVVTLSLKPEGSTNLPVISPSLEPGWDLKLNPNLPLDLKLKLAAGSQTLDLRGTNIQMLELETAVGSSILILPDQTITGTIKGAVGSITIKVPKDAAVLIRNDSGLAPISLPAGYIRDGQKVESPGLGTKTPDISLNISQAIGIIRIMTLP